MITRKRKKDGNVEGKVAKISLPAQREKSRGRKKKKDSQFGVNPKLVMRGKEEKEKAEENREKKVQN